MSNPPIKLSFGGLKKPIINNNNTKSFQPPKKLSTKPAFSFTDADEDLPPAPPEPKASTSKLPIGSVAPQPKVSTATLSRQQKLKQAQDLELDKSVYEYDEVYDNMKEGSRLAELEKKKDSGERKVSYFPNDLFAYFI